MFCILWGVFSINHSTIRIIVRVLILFRSCHLWQAVFPFNFTLSLNSNLWSDVESVPSIITYCDTWRMPPIKKRTRNAFQYSKLALFMKHLEKKLYLCVLRLKINRNPSVIALWCTIMFPRHLDEDIVQINTTAQRCSSETETFILEDLFSSVLSQQKTLPLWKPEI